jgi:aspartate-semialdehyde dehydrogenase
MVPLVVPEINGEVLKDTTSGLIANPNCSTIIALLPLAALHRTFGLEKVLLSTYQAVSGAGGSALREFALQLRQALKGKKTTHAVLPKPIHDNLIPWIGPEDPSGYCEEESKIAFESQKILDLPTLKISATTVRVPIRRCHSMAIWVRLKNVADLADVHNALAQTPGVVLADPPPCPAEVEGSDSVHVGRIRKDLDDERSYWLWVVSDQLRKGAALNAVQVVEKLHEFDKIHHEGDWE